jgi:Zn-dependent protease
MNDPAPEKSPQTPNEWGILVILSFFFALFLVVELAQDFSIQKLSVPFFLVSWVFLLILHELGHALMAWLLGWQVRLISIGTGIIRYQRTILGTPVEFRTLPLSGFVLPRPRNLSSPRVKNFLIYAAGPGIELLLVAILVVLVGPARMLQRSPEIGFIAVQSFCIAALFGAIFNLIPFHHRTKDGVAWSDGLGMILCWKIPDESYRRQMEGKD